MKSSIISKFCVTFVFTFVFTLMSCEQVTAPKIESESSLSTPLTEKSWCDIDSRMSREGYYFYGQSPTRQTMAIMDAAYQCPCGFKDWPYEIRYLGDFLKNCSVRVYIQHRKMN